MLRYALAFVVLGGISAASIDETLNTNTQSTHNTQISQAKIDKLSEKTQELFIEYRNELREIETLKTYNQQLRDVIAAQEAEAKSLNLQIVEIEVTQQRIMPLMHKMIESFVTFVQNDTPFLKEQRQEKLIRMQGLLSKANLTISQKFRHIVEAYGIELEFGRTIEAFDAKLGDKQSVHFLRIGRTGLYYLTRDEKEVGIYNPNTQNFETIDTRYIKSIKKGLKIANKQLAPELLKLPVVATKEVRQ